MANNVPQETLHWLYNVLTKDYQDVNRTYSDLAYTLDRFPTISPRTDVYTFEHGTSALLVHLVGTLPVTFRNMTYRFPIELWIPHAYPYEAPIAYITPTSGMMVRPSRHVSGEGRIYHPYLAHWAEAWNKSSIVDLLSMFCDIFSREPPVTSTAQPVSPPQQSELPPLPPPQHSEQTRVRQSMSAGSNSETPPPPPPKQQLGTDPRAKPPTRPPGRYDAPPPLPEAVTSSYSQPSQSDHRNSGPPSSHYSPSRNISGRDIMTPQSLQQEQRLNAPIMSQGVGGGVQSPTSPTGTPQRSPPGAFPVQIQPPSWQGSHSQPIVPSQGPSSEPLSSLPAHQQQARNVSVSYQERHLRPAAPSQSKPPSVNLLDSPFDLSLPASSSPNIPVPAVPPNPEKDALLSALSQSLTQTLHSEMSANAASLPPLRSQNVALNSSLHTLESEISQLQHLQDALSSNISILQSSLREADQCITSAHRRAQHGDIPRIDEMLVAPTVVGKQLYDVVCEQRGIEAATWALQAALTRGRIGVDIWARKTRELRREAFQRKILAGKIAAGMGLDGG